MGLRDLYGRFFDGEAKSHQPRPETLALARDLVIASQGVYLPALMAWLDQMARRPIPVGAHHEMIASAASSSAFADVLARIRRELDAAKRLLESLP